MNHSVDLVKVADVTFSSSGTFCTLTNGGRSVCERDDNRTEVPRLLVIGVCMYHAYLSWVMVNFETVYTLYP